MNAPAFAFSRSVSLLSVAATGQDAYGNDATTPTTTTIPGAVTWPRTSTEDADGTRDTVIVGLTVLVPPGVAVAATDRFLIDGVAYEVDGEPFDWSVNPFTDSRAGTQVDLKRVTG